MIKRMLCLVLVAAMCATLTPAVSAASRGRGFSDYGGYTQTPVEYTFLVEDSAMVYNKIVDLDWDYYDIAYAGSDLYVPIGAYDTTKEDPEEAIATEKQIKNDEVKVSYKVLTGVDYVDYVEVVSSKKAKLSDLPSGMYAKIHFTDTFLPLERSSVAVRLVISVNGVSYQDTAVTYSGYVQNRVQSVSRNSVYGALTPTQFNVSSNYYGEATFDFGDNIRYTARVSAKKKYYLHLDRSENAVFKELYPQAYLEYYNFVGYNDTFASTGKLEIPINKSKFKERRTSTQLYVYEVLGDQLSSLGKDTVTYNASTEKITIETQTLGFYVLSSRALLQNIADSAEEDILRTGYAQPESIIGEEEPPVLM